MNKPTHTPGSWVVEPCHQDQGASLAIVATTNRRVVARGTIAADNVNTLECREQLGWHIERVEMPIRDYNRLVKVWPHYGCGWDEIRSNLVKG